MLVIVVEYDSCAASNPDILINVGKTLVAVRAGLIWQEKLVLVNLKMPAAIRRRIFAVTVEPS
jgi:hypothetical protein